MAMKDRMHTGALYLPGDDEIMNRQQLCLDRLYEFNHTRPTEMDKRQALMKEMFAELGENCYIEPPFYSNFGGAHVHLGNHVYCNFAVTMVDDTHIYIGDNTMITPLTMQRLPGIWRKSNKYKTNPAGSRNGRLRGDFLYA